MKIFFFNNDLNDPSKSGSFTQVSRRCNEAAKKIGAYADMRNCDYIIYIDAFDVEKKFDRPCISWLVSEYNYAPNFLVNKINRKGDISLAISQQAKDSFVNSGVESEKIEVVHLGSSPDLFPNLKLKKNNSPFLFLSINTSNNRSGYNNFIPAFLEWASGKDVKLIIKDQFNPKFSQLLSTIDKEQKVHYIGENLNHNQLVQLYNRCNINCYLNSATSFGMNLMDGALTNLPCVVSRLPVIEEFTKDDLVTYVETDQVPVDSLLLAEWNAWGLVNNLLPLENYHGTLITARPKFQSIIDKLDYSYSNYLELVTKNEKYTKWILGNKTWEHAVKKIIQILNNK